MAYTNETQVRAIHKGVEVSEDLSIYIETANSIVEDILGDLGYTTTKLALIEAWLAAHFYAISSKETSMETASSVSEQYQYKLGLFLSNSMYGQQAMAIDTSGKLANLNKQFEKGSKTTLKLYHLGTERDPA